MGVTLLVAFQTAATAANAPHYKAIYRIDQVSAAIEDKKLVIHAEGAVNSGGWRRPRLVMRPSAPEASILRMDLVADPPPPKHVFIQELLPVAADLKTGLPKYGTVAVSVASQTNEVVAQIRR
jgi:hypothetical protein